ncbi:MAG: hypothetical protein KAJ09_06360 [Deltaproteobacteria bacterium]|nr:hypothetical protein [Deltaproteobacteria bacterium]
MKFLKNFISISRNYDFVVLDLAQGITRQTSDLALLADRTIVVTSPDDLMSGYASVRACFSRFAQLEANLFKKSRGTRLDNSLGRLS